MIEITILKWKFTLAFGLGFETNCLPEENVDLSDKSVQDTSTGGNKPDCDCCGSAPVQTLHIPQEEDEVVEPAVQEIQELLGTYE